ncbi:MAG: chromate transporter [Bacillota bacterium]
MPSKRMSRLAALFGEFFVVGLFTIGGGYAMLPVIRQQLVNKRCWLAEDEFYNGVTVAQTCPGPLAVNIAVYSGNHVAGPAGGLIAAFAVVLPAFLVMLVVAIALSGGSSDRLLKAALMGTRPAVAALLTYAAVMLARRALPHARAQLVALTALVALSFLRLHPIWVIAGVLVYGHLREHVRRRDRDHAGTAVS